MIRMLEEREAAVADLMTKRGSDAVNTRELAYRHYHMCEQKNDAQEAQDYNVLVQRWPEISKLSMENTLIPPRRG